MLGLEPDKNSAWDPKPHGWDLNPEKFMVFPLRSQTWFKDQMKLRFLMSHHRKNSMRATVIGKKAGIQTWPKSGLGL